MIKWNVDPVIIEIGPFALRYYSLMFVIGFIAMGEYVQKLFKKYGKSVAHVSPLTTYIILGMLIGSRLAHCLFYDPEYYFANPLDIFKIWEGGLASHGGYLGVIIAVWLYLRKHKDIEYLWLMDIISGPCLFVGGLIRIGNLFNSEIVGNPTDLPWAVIFEKVDLLPRHPSQVYEAIGYLIIAFILIWEENKKLKIWKQGTILSHAIIISFTFRFFIEYTKAEQSTLTVFNFMNMGQILSLAFVLFGFALLYLINKKKELFNN